MNWIDGGVVWRLLTELSVKVRSVLTAAARRDEPHDNKRNYSLNRCRVIVNAGQRWKRWAGIESISFSWPAAYPHTRRRACLRQHSRRMQDIGVAPGQCWSNAFSVGRHWTASTTRTQWQHINHQTCHQLAHLHNHTSMYKIHAKTATTQTQWINTLTPKSN